MKLGGIISLAARDLSATRARASISAAGIALGVAVLVVIAGLGVGAREQVLSEVVRRLPVDMVEVVPKAIDLGIIRADGLFGDNRLNDRTLQQLGSMKEVAKIYPKLEVKLPMGARGGRGLFGRDLYTDLFMVGLAEELVIEDAPEFRDNGEYVPVVISDQLIEVFNSSVAPSLGTPKLTDETLKGFEFEITIGRSLMLGRRGAAKMGSERARIVGVSRYAMRLGASVPLATARRLIATYGDEENQPSYASFLLKAASAADVPEIRRAVEAQGLAVDETAEQTSDMLTAATLLGSLVGLLVLVLAALNIAHSFFAALSERRRELAVLRAVGATRLDLVLMVLAQAAMLGAAGGVGGAVAARAVAWIVDWLAATLIPDFPFKPDSFFALPGWLFGIAFVAAVLAACLGALWPAWYSARAPVARALAE